jgi:hypothetical protein
MQDGYNISCGITIVEDLYQDFNVWTVLTKRPNGLTSNLLIMLILHKSKAERNEFS